MRQKVMIKVCPHRQNECLLRIDDCNGRKNCRSLGGKLSKTNYRQQQKYIRVVYDAL